MSRKVIAGPTDNDLLAQLREISAPARNTDAGVKTAKEWADEFGMNSLSDVRRLLNDGVDAGIMGTDVRRPRGSGNRCRHWWRK